MDETSEMERDRRTHTLTHTKCGKYHQTFFFLFYL